MAQAAVVSPQASTAALEAEITELWGHINAANYRFLKLIAEFDRTQGWGHHGCASCVQWLNWKCGIGPIAAREKLRVAHALEKLPTISDAFRLGRLSYSKVRAMTRIATPAMEGTLLNIALHGTASHMERLVRKFRRVEEREAAERTHRQYLERYLDFRYDEDGSLLLRGRLPPEIGAVVRRAIEAAVERAREEERAVRDSAESSLPARSPCSGHTGLPEEETAAIPIAARRADALVDMTRHFLAGDAAIRGSSADRYQIVVHVDEAALRGETQGSLERCHIEHGPTLAVATARRLACGGSIVGIVENDRGEPLDIGRKSRAIPPAIERALKTRDGGCRFPGCDRTRFTEGHHVRHWANGGETKLSNLVTLCDFHHRLVHEGGFSVRATDDGLFVFSRPDGSRIAPNGEPRFRGIVSRGSKAIRLQLLAMNTAHGLQIDADTSQTLWLGERLDYSLAIEALYLERFGPREASKVPRADLPKLERTFRGIPKSNGLRY